MSEIHLDNLLLDKSIQRAIGLGETLTEEQRHSILEMRARQLAQPISEAKAGVGETLRVMAFRMGKEMYAIPAASVFSVSKSVPITPVPCVPPYVAGITNLRGHIRSVVDLAKFLDLEVESPPEYVVVALYQEMEVAMLVSGLDEVTDIPTREIKPRPQVGHTLATQYIAGVVPGGLILLDLGAIFNDEKFIVNEEIS
jgi:purine-binding chemotaxis protein CheW